MAEEVNMSEDETQRDETHVEQHGDGDVNVEQPAEAPAETEQPAEAPAEDAPEGE